MATRSDRPSPVSDPNHYHVGWPPPDVWHVLDRIKRGLPTYWPTDPKPLDQTPYIEFSEKRGPNSE